jgi:GntR family transcriptional regulator, transcriptional repressor for pyruvate dehydrogenase complex
MMPLRLDRLSRGPHLPTLVASSISREIAEGRLRPGDRLPTEQELAVTFAVSRNVIREAIAHLRSQGRVWSQQGRGAFVADPVDQEVLEIKSAGPGSADAFRALFELRVILETEAAALAAERRKRADLSRIRKALETMAGCLYGSVPWLQSDLDFHVAIAAAARNRYLVEVLERVADSVRRSILAAGDRQSSEEMAQATLGEHEAVLAAIAAGRPDAARTAMARHLGRAADRVGIPAARGRGA